MPGRSRASSAKFRDHFDAYLAEDPEAKAERDLAWRPGASCDPLMSDLITINVDGRRPRGER